MAKSILVNQKKRGRPATGRDPVISARLPEATIRAIEKWAVVHRKSRAGAIRELIESALENAIEPPSKKRAEPHSRKRPGTPKR